MEGEIKMVKVLEKWNNNGNGLSLVNFKMENGDFNTIEWYSFRGAESTLVKLYHIDANEQGSNYKVIIHKELDFSGSDIGYQLQLNFYNGEEIVEIVRTNITRKQYFDTEKDLVTRRVIKAFYENVLGK